MGFPHQICCGWTLDELSEPVPFPVRVPGRWDGVDCFLSSVEEREKLLFHQRKEQSCFSMGAVGARRGVVIYCGTVITAQHLCGAKGCSGSKIQQGRKWR